MSSHEQPEPHESEVTQSKEQIKLFPYKEGDQFKVEPPPRLEFNIETEKFVGKGPDNGLFIQIGKKSSLDQASEVRSIKPPYLSSAINRKLGSYVLFEQQIKPMLDSMQGRYSYPVFALPPLAIVEMSRRVDLDGAKNVRVIDTHLEGITLERYEEILKSSIADLPDDQKIKRGVVFPKISFEQHKFPNAMQSGNFSEEEVLKAMLTVIELNANAAQIGLCSNDQRKGDTYLLIRNPSGQPLIIINDMNFGSYDRSISSSAVNVDQHSFPMSARVLDDQTSGRQLLHVDAEVLIAEMMPTWSGFPDVKMLCEEIIALSTRRTRYQSLIVSAQLIADFLEERMQAAPEIRQKYSGLQLAEIVSKLPSANAEINRQPIAEVSSSMAHSPIEHPRAVPVQSGDTAVVLNVLPQEEDNDEEEIDQEEERDRQIYKEFFEQGIKLIKTIQDQHPGESLSAAQALELHAADLAISDKVKVYGTSKLTPAESTFESLVTRYFHDQIYKSQTSDSTQYPENSNLLNFIKLSRRSRDDNEPINSKEELLQFLREIVNKHTPDE